MMEKSKDKVVERPQEVSKPKSANCVDSAPKSFRDILSQVTVLPKASDDENWNRFLKKASSIFEVFLVVTFVILIIGSVIIHFGKENAKNENQEVIEMQQDTTQVDSAREGER